MNKTILALALALFSLTFAPVPASAAVGSKTEGFLPAVEPARDASDFKPHMAILGGVGNLNGYYTFNPILALDGGFQPVIPISLGTQVVWHRSEIDFTNTDKNINTTAFLLKGAYNFGGDIDVLRYGYVGLKTGVVLYSGNFDSSTHFAWGPMAGVDIPLNSNKQFSIGGELAYLGVLGDNSPDTLSLLGVMKYWF